jgi:hypothetical protein
MSIATCHVADPTRWFNIPATGWIRSSVRDAIWLCSLRRFVPIFSLETSLRPPRTFALSSMLVIEDAVSFSARARAFIREENTW